jgi:N utilization substance protein A
LEQQIDLAVAGYMALEGMTEECAQRLVEQGYLSYDDLSVIEPDQLMEMGGFTEEQVQLIVDQAEERALEQEAVVAEEKRKKREQMALEEAEGKKNEAKKVEEPKAE